MTRDQPSTSNWQDFPRPSLAVDLVVLRSTSQGQLEMLTLRRPEHPFAGELALPGGFVRPGESVERAAARVLAEKTGLSGLHPWQLRVFSEPDRDPRGWVVSVALLALIHWEQEPKLDSSAASFRPVLGRGDALELEAKPQPLAFDHDAIAHAALSKLRQMLQSEPIIPTLLPPEFTLPQALNVSQALEARQLDKAAFRTKVRNLGLVAETGKQVRGAAHRPAKLYRWLPPKERH